MNNLKIAIIVIGVGLIISISFAGSLLVSSSNERYEFENEIKNINTNLQDNITKLLKTEEELNSSELFLKSYLNGLGNYYNSTEIYEKADYKYNQAKKRYDDGYWGSAIAWFQDSMVWYNNAGDKYVEARDIFKNAMHHTSITAYQNICELYYNMMNVSFLGTVYLYESSDYYASSCEYYIDGDYNEAHRNRDLAEEKIRYYEEEMVKFENYQLDLQNLLIEIS